MGVETENYEIAAKGFENTDFVVCILVVPVSREILPVGYLKGRYKSECSLMTCVAELHGSVIRMPCSILSHIGTDCGQSVASRTSCSIGPDATSKQWNRCSLKTANRHLKNSGQERPRT